MASKPNKTAAGGQPPPDTQTPPPGEGADGDMKPPHAPAPGPTQGELDEAIEDNLNLKAENAKLTSVLEEMMQRMARLERLSQGRPAYERPTEGVDRDRSAEVPVFDEQDSFGTIWGDSEVAFVQGGHYFGPDKSYVRSDEAKHRGSSRTFDPRRVGLIVPRVAKAA